MQYYISVVFTFPSGSEPAQFNGLHQDEIRPCQPGLHTGGSQPGRPKIALQRLIQAVCQLDGNPQRFSGRGQVRRRRQVRPATWPDRRGKLLPLFGLAQAGGMDAGRNDEKSGQHEPDKNDGKDDPGGHIMTPNKIKSLRAELPEG